MVKQTPLEELKCLLPNLEGQLCPADVGYVTEAYQFASGEKVVPEVFKGLKNRLAVTIRYLKPIAENTSYYKNRPEAQKLLQTALGLIGKIE